MFRIHITIYISLFWKKSHLIEKQVFPIGFSDTLQIFCRLFFFLSSILYYMTEAGWKYNDTMIIFCWIYCSLLFWNLADTYLHFYIANILELSLEFHALFPK